MPGAGLHSLTGHGARQTDIIPHVLPRPKPSRSSGLAAWRGEMPHARLEGASQVVRRNRIECSWDASTVRPQTQRRSLPTVRRALGDWCGVSHNISSETQASLFAKQEQAFHRPNDLRRPTCPVISAISPTWPSAEKPKRHPRSDRSRCQTFGTVTEMTRNSPV